MNVFADIVKKQKISIIVTAAVLVLVSVYYFVWASPYPGMTYVYGDGDAAIYTDMELKAAYKDGALKVFALANPAALSDYRAAEGDAVPTDNSVVIGWAEGRMMQRERLFTKPGDTITGLFGIDPVVGGVLKRTYGLMDDMHFVSEADYARVQGEEERLFIVVKDATSPKLFFVLPEGQEIPITLTFAEGSLADYSVREMGGRRYQPVILGANEAAMMKFERLIDGPGDTIGGFFGNDIFIAGILAPTDTIIDMAHISPLTAADIR